MSMDRSCGCTASYGKKTASLGATEYKEKPPEAYCTATAVRGILRYVGSTGKCST